MFLPVDCAESCPNCKRSQHIYGLRDSWQSGQQRLRSWHQSADISPGKTARNQVLYGAVPFPILHHSQRHQRVATDPEWRTETVVWTGVYYGLIARVFSVKCARAWGEREEACHLGADWRQTTDTAVKIACSGSHLCLQLGNHALPCLTACRIRIPNVP